jgi:glucose/arabinose dehydrogenase
VRFRRRQVVAVPLATVALTLVSCTDEGDIGTGGGAPTTTTAPPATVTVPPEDPVPPADPVSPADPAPGPTTGEGRLEDAEIGLTVVAELDAPTTMTVRPGGDLLWVAERAGRVRLLDPATGEVSEPVVELAGDTTTDSERGLLGMAFAADGSELYLSWTDRDGHSVVDARPVGEDGSLGAPRVLLRVEQPASNHNGGDLRIGPDGYLYVALGDGGGGGDPFATGQDPGSLLGTILRIDPDGDPYAVPDDNPFADGGGAPEVWLFGVRNPWRIAFDPATGDLWVADVGQRTIEEINRLPAAQGAGRGANLGWSRMEGTRPFQGGPEPPDHVPPVFEYGHDEGCSVTGGVVYRGSDIPALVGSYLFSDYCEPELRAVQVRDGDVVHRRLGVSPAGGSVVSFGEGPDGEVYVLSLSGPVSRIVAAQG